MAKKYLIITTAHLSDVECQKNGYSYESRVGEYVKSFDTYLSLSENFDKCIILETKSKSKIDYLENSGIEVFYSSVENIFINKGWNEVHHLKNFIENLELSDDDIIYKITGRYQLNGIELLNFHNYDCVAKDDRDIYPNPPNGVHTFYFSITKKYFIKFYEFLDLNLIDFFYKRNICVEWELKRYMEQNLNCKIISFDDRINITTCVFDGRKWLKVDC